MESLNIIKFSAIPNIGTTLFNAYGDFIMQDNQRQTLLAYTAGVLDSDGAFMIVKNSSTRKNPNYMATVKIAMVHEDGIKAITNELGYGRYRLEGTRKSRPNSLPIFHWYIRDRKKVKPFLEEVLPYLRNKVRQAKFLLEFCNKYKPCRIPKFGLDKKELDYREESYWKMKALNKEAYDSIRKLNDNKVAATTESQRSERISDSLNS